MLIRNREWIAALRKMGVLFFLPILYLVVLAMSVWTRIGAQNFDSAFFSRAIVEWVPIFAAFYPILSLWDVYDKNGGKIHYAYRPTFTYWIFRNLVYFIIYVAMANLIFGGIALCRSDVQALYYFVPLLSISWYYSWLGMFTMVYTTDGIWSTFITIALFILLSIGPMSAWDYFNPHNQTIPLSLHDISWRPVLVGFLWGVMYIILIAMKLHRRKG